MYELIQLTDHDYYIDCPAKIGLVRISDDEVILIDSGNDKDAGKKILRVIEANHWKLHAVLNTHSHADHIGGNRFLQDRTGCTVYAKGLECAYANDPILEPIGLYGGKPFKELRHKFLMAQESKVTPLTDNVVPSGIRVLDLPGHCFSMTGFITPEGTAYIADSVSSEETLVKYGIGYLWDPKASLETLEALKTLSAARFVPAHAPVTEDISSLAELNIQAIKDVIAKITDLCRTPMTFEALLKSIFDSYGLQLSAQQYALIGSTLRSYLSSLYEQDIVSFIFEENMMFWRTL